MIVADFSMNNGRENRNNGNQEKGKKEKEALRRSVRSQKGGRRKRPLSFCAEVRTRLGDRRSVQPLPAALLRFPGVIRNRLFLGRTQSTEGAKIAMKADLRLEVSGGDAARHSQYSFFRSLQLKLGAAGEDRNIAFEIMKHQSADRISPLLLCSHGVDRKLQAFVGIFLGSSLAGLVVD